MPIEFFDIPVALFEVFYMIFQNIYEIHLVEGPNICPHIH